jgi:hypothetical protein
MRDLIEEKYEKPNKKMHSFRPKPMGLLAKSAKSKVNKSHPFPYILAHLAQLQTKTCTLLHDLCAGKNVFCLGLGSSSVFIHFLASFVDNTLRDVIFSP